jgi:hypothetical protein
MTWSCVDMTDRFHYLQYHCQKELNSNNLFSSTRQIINYQSSYPSLNADSVIFHQWNDIGRLVKLKQRIGAPTWWTISVIERSLVLSNYGCSIINWIQPTHQFSCRVQIEWLLSHMFWVTHLLASELTKKVQHQHGVDAIAMLMPQLCADHQPLRP